MRWRTCGERSLTLTRRYSLAARSRERIAPGNRGVGAREERPTRFISAITLSLNLFILQALPLGKLSAANDALAREQAMSPEQRLRFHQEYTEPSMKGLHEWMKAQLAEHKTKPNSGLGKAISYLLNHWLKLTLFLRQAGAPIDNNLVEREKGDSESQKRTLLQDAERHRSRRV